MLDRLLELCIPCYLPSPLLKFNLLTPRVWGLISVLLCLHYFKSQATPINKLGIMSEKKKWYRSEKNHILLLFKV